MIPSQYFEIAMWDSSPGPGRPFSIGNSGAGAWNIFSHSRQAYSVKIKYADFQQATRSRTLSAPVLTRELLRAVSLDLVRSIYPPAKGIRLSGVTLSSFEAEDAAAPAQLGLDHPEINACYLSIDLSIDPSPFAVK